MKDPHSKREAKKYDNPVASREMLLEIIAKTTQPPTYHILAKMLQYKDDSRKEGLKRRLRAMENSGQLLFNQHKQYEVPDQSSVLTGKISAHRDGFGFFTPIDDTGADVKITKQGKNSKDLYVSSHEMKKVFHGDIVQAILIDRSDRKGRKEIKILNVVQPRTAPIVGRYYVDHHICIVVPDDARINHEILIDPNEKLGARNGQIVVVEIIKWPNARFSPVGKIIEVLGEHMAPGMEIDIALRTHDLPHQFSEQVLEEVSAIADEVEDQAKIDRVDLRDLPLVTIDGEDARDFDDAVYCQPKKGGGWRLWVAIADVSYYVRGSTALDDEAISRGNSVYFPSQVIPMLPEKLSNGLCSLNPDVDRLCMVCEMTVSATGKLSSSKFYSATMRSKARFTYTKVANILANKTEQDQALREQYSPLVADLENLNNMYLALNDARSKRGAIAFETQESVFLFNKERKIDAIVPLIRNDAHKIIEECMILANVATAKYIEKHNMAGLFRVHDKPSEDKYNNFINYLTERGIQLSFLAKKKAEPEPKDYGEILAAVKGRPDQELIQTMLLRSMRQAVYQSDNLGHFGLALESYAHFTSPIRRYPDLVVHRVIKAILHKENMKNNIENTANDGHFTYPIEAVIELGEHCSMTERRADEATRDVADWLKCEFMQDHVGDNFTGVISTVTNFGIFVRLHELHIEGLVHITSLGRDFYHYDDARMCLSGENSGITYRVGDTVNVRVAAVNLDEKKIDLAIDELTDTQGKKSRSKTKAKSKKSTDKQANKRTISRDTASKITKKAKTKAKSKTKVKSKKRLGKNARKQTKD